MLNTLSRKFNVKRFRFIYLQLHGYESKIKFCSENLRPLVLPYGHFVLQGISDNLRRHSGLPHSVECYWHLVGRGQECWQASYHHHSSLSRQRIIWPKMSIVPQKLRNIVLDTETKTFTSTMAILYSPFCPGPILLFMSVWTVCIGERERKTGSACPFPVPGGHTHATPSMIFLLFIFSLMDETASCDGEVSTSTKLPSLFEYRDVGMQ